MADKKISQLTAAAALTGSEPIPTVQGGVTVQTTAQAIAGLANATHTGEVTGATALTVDKTAITNKTAVTLDGADYVLFSDTSDSGNLKKGLISDIGFDDGDFCLVASFKSLYNY